LQRCAFFGQPTQFDTAAQGENHAVGRLLE
jgi:hypothetical protein